MSAAAEVAIKIVNQDPCTLGEHANHMLSPNEKHFDMTMPVAGTPKKRQSRPYPGLWRGNASTPDEDTTTTTTAASCVRRKSKKDCALSKSSSAHTPKSPGSLLRFARKKAACKEAEGIMSACELSTSELSSPKKNWNPPRKSQSLLVLSSVKIPKAGHGTSSPRLRTSKSTLPPNVVVSLDLSVDDEVVHTSKRKTSKSKRHLCAAGSKTKGKVKKEEATGLEGPPAEELGDYSSDGGLRSRINLLRAKQLVSNETSLSATAEMVVYNSDGDGPSKRRAAKKALLPGLTNGGTGYSSDGGLATKKRALRKHSRDSAKAHYMVEQKASTQSLVGEENPQSANSVLLMAPTGAELESRQLKEELAKNMKQMLAKERAEMLLEREEIQKERAHMGEIRETLAFERESLELQLQEEARVTESLQQEIYVLQIKLEERNSSSEADSDLIDLTGENESLRSQLERVEHDSEQLINEKDKMLDALIETLAKVNHHFDGTTAESDGDGKKSKERLQGELLQANSKVLDREGTIDRQSMFITELKKQLTDLVDVQKVQDRLRNFEISKKELEAMLIKEQKQCKRKIKSKDEAIAFLIEELANANAAIVTGSSVGPFGDTGTITLNDDPSATKKEDHDELDSSQHSIGALLQFAGFRKSSGGGVRERYEQRKSRSNHS